MNVQFKYITILFVNYSSTKLNNAYSTIKLLPSSSKKVLYLWAGSFDVSGEWPLFSKTVKVVVIC